MALTPEQKRLNYGDASLPPRDVLHREREDLLVKLYQAGQITHPRLVRDAKRIIRQRKKEQQ